MNNFNIFKFTIDEIKFQFALYSIGLRIKDLSIYNKNEIYISKITLEELSEPIKGETLRLNEELIESGRQNFYNFVLFQVFLLYKKNRFLSFFENERYSSAPFDIETIDNDFYDNKPIILEGKFIISEQMINFANDFIFFKLLKIKKTSVDKLEDPNTDENERKLLEKEIKERIYTAQGLNELFIRSDKTTGEKKPIKDTELFVTIFKKSINQLYQDLPFGNKVFDRVSKNFLNIIRGTPENEGVRNATNNALKNHKVKFKYVKSKKGPYCIVNDLDYDSEYTDLEIITIFHEVIDAIPPREWKTGKKWRPYSNDRLVQVLKAFAYGIDGRVYINHLNKVFIEVLRLAKDLNRKKDAYDSIYLNDDEGNEYNRLDISHQEIDTDITNYSQEYFYNFTVQSDVTDLINKLQENIRLDELYKFNDDLKKYLKSNINNLYSIHSQNDLNYALSELKSEFSKTNEFIIKNIVKTIKKLNKSDRFTVSMSEEVSATEIDYGHNLRTVLTIFLEDIEKMKEIEEN